MRKFSIQGIRLRRRARTTIPEPSATPVPDLFQRDFTAPAPGIKYMGDITYRRLELVAWCGAEKALRLVDREVVAAVDVLGLYRSVLRAGDRSEIRPGPRARRRGPPPV